MRAAQVRATLLWALCAVAAAQEGVPRRGPPRGPIKEDKSTFFGKEGDQSQREASPFTQFALDVHPKRVTVEDFIRHQHLYRAMEYPAEVMQRIRDFYGADGPGTRAQRRRTRRCA